MSHSNWSQIAGETNPITDHTLSGKIDRSDGRVPLSDPNLTRIVRLRLLDYTREMPWWDVSYCWGQMSDGRYVEVDLGTTQISGRVTWHLVELCKQAGRYARGLGLLDSSVISKLPG